ncbi:MAG: tRNA lysidine(34) synthetase TilS [Candidatus Bipolaricaulota bacterium]|nr:MAG: tRNA lysidine(34) synthetase TilS [Candidatus Bipolaricaulota bacterium]
MLLNRVRDTILEYDMVLQGDGVAVAVSGGADSVVLLDLLGRLAPELGLRLVVCHLDHGLRLGSDEDARFVARLADARDLPFHGERIDVASTVEEHGGNIEAAARACRHDFLRRAAESHGARRIALGHTLNDRAESTVFHLARGAGTRGLGTMAAVREPFIRPLIETTRVEVVAYARSRGLSWREDPTNDDLSRSRNRIRHRVLPELAQINPRAAEAIARAAKLAHEETTLLAELLDPAWQEVVRSSAEGQVTLDREALTTFRPSMRRALLRRALAEARGDLLDLEHEHVRAVERILDPYRGPRSLNLPRATVRVTREELQVASPGATGQEGDSASLGGACRPVHLGRNEWADLDVSFDLTMTAADDVPTPVDRDRSTEFADADRIAFPLNVRSRRTGDRFHPLGMARDKTLRRFMIDAHVPVRLRKRWPLLCDGERIIWVPGVRLSEEVRVTEDTRRILVMHAEGLPWAS